MQSESIHIQKIKKLKEDRNWSFVDITRKETLYVSHGYHKYPAKFIPQLVRKLINKYSKEDDTVLDPFGGCGTTLVEAKIAGRNSIGTDISRIAVLISRAKTNFINPNYLDKRNLILINKLLDI